MANSWKLLLIISGLWNSIEGARECVMLENWDLEIPNNPVVTGSDKDPWYSNVNWQTAPDQDDNSPTLTYKMDRWIENSYGGGDWEENRSGSTSLCDSDVETEKGSLAALARSAVGLAQGCPITEGMKPCSSNLFSRFDDCHLIYFDGDLLENTKKRIYLDIDDADGNKLLTGRIIIPIGGRVHT